MARYKTKYNKQDDFGLYAANGICYEADYANGIVTIYVLGLGPGIYFQSVALTTGTVIASGSLDYDPTLPYGYAVLFECLEWEGHSAIITSVDFGSGAEGPRLAVISKTSAGIPNGIASVSTLSLPKPVAPGTEVDTLFRYVTTQSDGTILLCYTVAMYYPRPDEPDFKDFHFAQRYSATGAYLNSVSIDIPSGEGSLRWSSDFDTSSASSFGICEIQPGVVWHYQQAIRLDGTEGSYSLRDLSGNVKFASSSPPDTEGYKTCNIFMAFGKMWASAINFQGVGNTLGARQVYLDGCIPKFLKGPPSTVLANDSQALVGMFNGTMYIPVFSGKNLPKNVWVRPSSNSRRVLPGWPAMVIDGANGPTAASMFTYSVSGDYSGWVDMGGVPSLYVRRSGWKVGEL